ncbi:MAG: DUF4054 domain-containing protein [Gammaproteobacteria bacterium]|nr:DUF4054 domain-containing protein [Gammaproteobacteria bacterium]MBU0771790.1 DUF4054 domain-containing protein [Gammaproteobacteria bacterium]MBU0855546.1 DUF4054 domain-containing protein [Gammaproteobacteria bacterium]MBU1846108.1 DUF4054 domain-containing protein [Gammaproteobacteria bacterium]
MDPAAFRSRYPEFSDVNEYPDPLIQVHLTAAGMLLLEQVWGELMDMGHGLFVAHNITIGRRHQLAADAGGVPGEVTGPKTSKTVDKVSASYDTSAVTMADGGFWNSTAYGVELLYWARLIGMGGRQL